MPIRFSISGAFFPGNSSSWNDTATWYGGIVPTASDQVYVRGLRTTVNLAGGYLPFFGTQSITVASTVGFPVSGSFYTYTDRDEELKFNYIKYTRKINYYQFNIICLGKGKCVTKYKNHNN